jgi:tripeptidyl-peptidase I
MNPRDLRIFLRKYRPEAKHDKLIPKLINGGMYPDFPVLDDEQEAALDLEYASGLTYPVNTTLYQIGGVEKSVQKVWDILDSHLCDAESGSSCPGGVCEGCAGLTNVISISYGADESKFSPSFMKRECHEYMKMGLQGTSVIYSSGDSGMCSPFGHNCRVCTWTCIDHRPSTFVYLLSITNIGPPIIRFLLGFKLLTACTTGVAGRSNVCIGPNKKSFNPHFPASCPFITSVGATMIPVGGSTADQEVAAQQKSRHFNSGGGFSNVFDLPQYQKQTVSTWLETHKHLYPAGTFNNSGTVRAFPDVSANGKNYVSLFELM